LAQSTEDSRIRLWPAAQYDQRWSATLVLQLKYADETTQYTSPQKSRSTDIDLRDGLQEALDCVASKYVAYHVNIFLHSATFTALILLPLFYLAAAGRFGGSTSISAVDCSASRLIGSGCAASAKRYDATPRGWIVPVIITAGATFCAKRELPL
jgi:hypothetical protein